MTHILETSNIIATGGAGTLGNAIAERRAREGWSGKLTVYSTDNHKHEVMRRKYPDVQFVQGDIRNAETLHNAMVGHDVCLHLAAVKVIPDSEWWSLDTLDVNVNGSINVCVQAINAGIAHVLGISTDKSCHPANLYGATKYSMEKIFQEYSRTFTIEPQFHLVRYGNVIESNSSVIPMWKDAIARGEPIKITDPAMTRFWLSPQQAVDIVLASLDCASGNIYIPKMKSLSIGKLANYVLGAFDHVIIPLRPGEKIHETLLTEDECKHTIDYGDHFVLHPTTSGHMPYHLAVQLYTSEHAPELTKNELLSLLENA